MPRVASAAAAHVGSHIAKWRAEKKMAQDALAATSGIDSANIRAYENGRAMPSIHSLVRIATALEVKPGVLLEDLTLGTFTPSGQPTSSSAA